jgi:SAM-dependent methyltransferase
MLPVKRVRTFERLRTVKPISSCWGDDRGRCIDRYYIEGFLAAHRADIHGRTLEIQDDEYTRKFGTGVTRADILHVVEGNPKATIVANLVDAPEVSSNAFDCVICTQTLFLIYDVRAAIATIFRILKPGGIVLVTVPGIAHKISRHDMDRWGDYWRFTSKSIRQLFSEYFPRENVHITVYGNVLSAIAFLHGLATEELSKEELDYLDPDFEVSIGVRAIKPLLSRNESSSQE